MSITRIEPGKRFALATVHGNTVYLAGQVADKTAGKSVTEQTTEILATIDRLLAAAGTDKTKMLMVNIWLTDISTFGDERGVGRLGAAGPFPRPRDGGSKARGAAVHGRNRGDCREVGIGETLATPLPARGER